ncbi:MAG: hypothetical protein IJC10_01845 [Clostridia bacterium]|nr:hypothetical protein [Clostridia bacterium]
MHMTCRLLAVGAGIFAFGLFAGLILPAMWLVVMLAAILIFVACCILCC